MIYNKYLYIFILTIFVPVAYFSVDIDVALSKFFFDEASQTFSSSAFFNFITTWGVVPAQLTAIAAFIVLMLSIFSAAWAPCKKYALLLVLPMIFGAGCIVHTVFKDHWDRPRPRQVDLFGGHQSFRPFYQFNPSWKSQQKSFPCGHCTMGFYFFSFIFLGWRLNNRFLITIGSILALSLGILLSAARIAQGAHFFSDTLITALIMWLVTLACDLLIFAKPFGHTKTCKA